MQLKTVIKTTHEKTAYKKLLVNTTEWILKKIMKDNAVSTNNAAYNFAQCFGI